MSNPFEDIMNSLVESFDRETPNEITYKDFMSANKDDSLYDIFNTYDMAASEPSMIICKMIKAKYGIKRMDDELYWFIREFPVYIDKLSKEIHEKEGAALSVDKAWSRGIKHLDELIKANIAGEKNNGRV